MNSFLDKLGLYDFFSLIVGGLAFLLGIDYIGIINLQEYVLLPKPENWGIYTIAVILISYLLGGFFNLVSDKAFAGRKYRHLKKTILSETDSAIKNSVKTKMHRMRACDILKKRNIFIQEEELDVEHSAFYFNYCSYYLQMKGQHGKMEKLRGIMRLHANLTVCFFFLIVSSLYVIVTRGFAVHSSAVNCLFFSVILSITSYNSFRISAKSWARIVVNAFDVCYDINHSTTNL